MSRSAQNLQDEPWIDDFFNLVVVEALPLFEYLNFDFPSGYDVLTPTHQRETLFISGSQSPKPVAYNIYSPPGISHK